MKLNKRYFVYDAYDCYMSGNWTGKLEYIGQGNNKREVTAIIRQRDDETDGENYIIIYDRYNKEEVSLDMVGLPYKG